MTQEAGVPAGFWERVEQIAERAVAKYARSGALRNASITGGGGLTIGGGGDLTVAGGRFRAKYSATLGGGDAVYVGDMYSSVDGAYLGTGLLVQAPDGTDLAMFRYDEVFGRTRWDLYDSGNRIIVGNDASSGQGLARPYLPASFYRTQFAHFDVSTTSATFQTLWEAQIHKQLPRLEVGARATMDTAATTGELRVLVNGVAFGATFAQSFLVQPNIFGPATVAGAHMDVLTVEIQGRVTSGSGALRVEPQYLVGRQSP